MSKRAAFHVAATLLFAAILVLNHKLALNLTVTELGILAAVLGIHQVTSVIRAIRAPEEKPDA